MVVELNDFIHVHENAIDSSVCDKLISIFEMNSDLHERLDNDKRPNFTQLNLSENKELSPEVNSIHNLLIANTFEYKKKYYDFVDSRCFPEKHNFEQFRIKKYNPDGNDQFDTHVDVQDYLTARRFLSFMWYLNDVNDGGETIFRDFVIKPKKGTLLVFPPLWMFPHRGAPPISNAKYILSTYFHYK